LDHENISVVWRNFPEYCQNSLSFRCHISYLPRNARMSRAKKASRSPTVMQKHRPGVPAGQLLKESRRAGA
jgi:hypothetical protein